MTERTLAGTAVRLPELGIGTWAWGDRGTWGMGSYDQSLTEQTSVTRGTHVSSRA